MRNIAGLVALACALVFASGIATAKNIEPRIVGGTDASASDWPWKAAIVLKGSSVFVCGASLIDSRWVMTAAHCVFDLNDNLFDPGDLEIVINRNELSGFSGEVIDVEFIVAHPQYNNVSNDNDIALIKLDTPSSNTPIAIASSTEMASVNVGDLATVIGWGVLDEDETSLSDTLQQVDIPIVSNTTCNAANSYDGTITDNMICAGFAEGEKDACQGDSGGPLMIELIGTWYQIGVVSFGEGCARADKYGVYSRVANYADWINLAINGVLVDLPNVYFGAGLGFDQSQTINIYNVSGSTQNITNINITGTDSGDFTLANNTCLGNISDNGSCAFDLIFNTASVGEKSATLNVVLASALTSTNDLEAWGLTPSTNANSTIGNWDWHTGGHASWAATSSQDNSSNGSMGSGAITHNQISILSARHNSGPGTFEFALKTSSEQSFDYAEIYLNGDLHSRESGNTIWCRKSLTLTQTNNLIHIVYRKDAAVDDNLDRVFVDEALGGESTLCSQVSSSGGGSSGGGGGGSFHPLFLLTLIGLTFLARVRYRPR